MPRINLLCWVSVLFFCVLVVSSLECQLCKSSVDFLNTQQAGKKYLLNNRKNEYTREWIPLIPLFYIPLIPLYKDAQTSSTETCRARVNGKLSVRILKVQGSCSELQNGDINAPRKSGILAQLQGRLEPWRFSSRDRVYDLNVLNLFIILFMASFQRQLHPKFWPHPLHC